MNHFWGSLFTINSIVVMSFFGAEVRAQVDALQSSRKSFSLSSSLQSQSQVPWDIESSEDFLEPLNIPESMTLRKAVPSGGITLDVKYDVFSTDLLQQEWVKTFDVVIVVNRAISGLSKQTLRLYYKGEPYFFQDLNGNLTDVVNVSTGRIFNNRSATPVGYFSPTFLSRNHVSSQYGSPMPFATFFIGGYAIHRVPYEKQEALIGQAVSAGCVRVSKNFVPQIFELVEAAGTGSVAQFSREGRPLLDPNGNLLKKNGYKTMVIVEDVVD